MKEHITVQGNLQTLNIYTVVAYLCRNSKAYRVTTTTECFLTAVAHVEETVFILKRIIHSLYQACCEKRKQKN